MSKEVILKKKLLITHYSLHFFICSRNRRLSTGPLRAGNKKTRSTWGGGLQIERVWVSVWWGTYTVRFTGPGEGPAMLPKVGALGLVAFGNAAPESAA